MQLYHEDEGTPLLLIGRLNGRFASEASARLLAVCPKVVDDTGHYEHFGVSNISLR